MSRYAKAIAAAVTVGLAALAEALPEYNSQVQLVIGLIGIVSVYWFKNAPPEPEPLP